MDGIDLKGEEAWNLLHTTFGTLDHGYSVYCTSAEVHMAYPKQELFLVYATPFENEEPEKQGKSLHITVHSFLGPFYEDGDKLDSLLSVYQEDCKINRKTAEKDFDLLDNFDWYNYLQELYGFVFENDPHFYYNAMFLYKNCPRTAGSAIFYRREEMLKGIPKYELSRDNQNLIEKDAVDAFVERHLEAVQAILMLLDRNMTPPRARGKIDVQYEYFPDESGSLSRLPRPDCELWAFPLPTWQRYSPLHFTLTSPCLVYFTRQSESSLITFENFDKWVVPLLKDRWKELQWKFLEPNRSTTPDVVPSAQHSNLQTTGVQLNTSIFSNISE